MWKPVCWFVCLVFVCLSTLGYDMLANTGTLSLWADAFRIVTYTAGKTQTALNKELNGSSYLNVTDVKKILWLQ